MIKCNFTDIRNLWETETKISGHWCDIKNEMIKQAAKCRNYNSDVIYDINGIEKKITKGTEFICHELFYECGIHSTLEFSGNEWTEEQKLDEMKKHSSNCFCILCIEFRKVSERDYELTCEDVTLAKLQESENVS